MERVLFDAGDPRHRYRETKDKAESITERHVRLAEVITIYEPNGSNDTVVSIFI